MTLFDTSSLLALVRYYLPFDGNGKIKEFIQSQYEAGEIVIIDKVITEAKFLVQGIILKELNFIDPKSPLIINTANLQPGQKFYNLLENSFCNKAILRLRSITPFEFEIEKSRYLGTADANLILYAQLQKSKKPLIVTEETKTANDNKIFKKIPDCCDSVDIQCCSLPVFLKNHLSTSMQF